MRTSIGVVLFALSVFAQAAAPVGPAQAASKVLAAFRAGDTATLETLAAQSDPDPWLVAEELSVGGEHDAAAAFAKAAPGAAAEELPAYVASRRGREPDAAVHAALAASRKAMGAGDAKGAVRALESLSPDAATVTGLDVIWARGQALRALRDVKRSGAAYEACGEGALAIGWLTRAEFAFRIAGSAARALGDNERAAEHWNRCREIGLRCAGAGDVASVQVALGMAYQAMGEYRKALAIQQDSIARFERGEGDVRNLGPVLANLGITYRALGEYEAARRCCERSLLQFAKIGYRQGESSALNTLANLRARLGEPGAALSLYERSLAIDRKLGDLRGASTVLENIGLLQAQLGDYEKAGAALEEALSLKEKVKDLLGTAHVLGSLGMVLHTAGDDRGAIPVLERALRMSRKLDNRPLAAIALGNLGTTYGSLGKHEKAHGFLVEALSLARALRDPYLQFRGAGFAALNAMNLGEREKAFAFQKRMLELAEASASHRQLASAWWLHARLLHATGRSGEAVAAAHRAVDSTLLVLGGLADEQSARARSAWAKDFDVALGAAVAAKDAAAAFRFLEAARAGTLLESLRGGDLIRLAHVPEKLRDAEVDARLTERRAFGAFAGARAGGDRKAIRSSRRALDAARGQTLRAVERIRRAAKLAAGVVYPEIVTVKAARARLEEGDALVLYGLRREAGAVAVVLTRKTTRLVPLGSREAIVAAGRAFDPSRPDATPDPAALSALVVAPLALPATVRRLLVSPEGPLSFVPFGLLAPGREIVYVPSATALARLEAGAASQKVLALGDPEYGNRATALPATREEASAVGDVVLLGARASEPILREHLDDSWRAVHLACHGEVDPRRPLLSSILLAADGALTVHEVLRTRIRADLAVLSACETARGRVFEADGVLGFTTAFMVAGVPRVIGSLWKVDDEATQALMVTFYEHWKTGRIPAATALRRAQESVRSRAKWKHPSYWAAWQLWGLPD